MNYYFLIGTLLFLFNPIGYCQQQPDTVFTFRNDHPAYLRAMGPTIAIDAAHFNYHTADDGFLPFVELLHGDGYQIRSNREVINQSSLDSIDILIIVNALHADNALQWVLPTPSAFTTAEINDIRQWVEDGGSLLLIADHMPFSGAAQLLGKAFGFEYLNGFARTGRSFWPPTRFNRVKGTLHDHIITNGKQPEDSINQVLTFTGSAIRIPEDARPILSFNAEKDSILFPDTAWQFSPSTTISDLVNCHQGAVMNYGKGRIAVFAEAAMFTAQTLNQGRVKVGFNSSIPNQNARFILNLIHWLDRSKSAIDSLKIERERILQDIFREMEQAVVSERSESVSRYYTADAKIVGNNTFVKGRKEIRQYWAAMKNRAINWTLEQTDLLIDEDLMVQSGISRLKYVNDYDQVVVSAVRFTLVWIHSQEGWRIKIDHYTPL